jgi:hypothetical protein
VAGKLETCLQVEALGDFDRAILGAPFAIEDGVSHDVDGVRAAQATKVDEGHRSLPRDLLQLLFVPSDLSESLIDIELET